VAFGHEAIEQGQHAVGAVDEAAHQLPWIDAGLLTALIEPGLGASRIFGGWQPEEGQEVA